MRRRVLLGLGLLLLVGLVVTVTGFKDKTENKVTEIAYPTSIPEVEFQPEIQPTRPVFSPNGKYLVYLWGYQVGNNWNISFIVALVEDFRTAKWPEIIQYPELVYQKSQQYLQQYAN